MEPMVRPGRAALDLDALFESVAMLIDCLARDPGAPSGIAPQPMGASAHRGIGGRTAVPRHRAGALQQPAGTFVEGTWRAAVQGAMMPEELVAGSEYYLSLSLLSFATRRNHDDLLRRMQTAQHQLQSLPAAVLP